MPSLLEYTNTSLDSSSSFEEFFDGWVSRQRDLSTELLHFCERGYEEKEETMKCLIHRVLAHYERYYEEKSKLVGEKVFVLFSPPWFSTFERTFLWIAGFKPGMAFRVLARSVRDMSPEQMEMMDRLKAETNAIENELNFRLANLQESVAALDVVELVCRFGREVNREILQTVGALTESLQGLVLSADYLRATTAREVVHILEPVQAVRFLAEIARLQLKIRDWGIMKDAQRRSGRGMNEHDGTIRTVN